MNTPTNQSPAGCAAFAPSLTTTELTHRFIQTKKQVRKYNEDSEYLNALSHACGLLSINRQDFTRNQFLVLTRAFHDSAEATHALLCFFEDWLAFMRLNRKIRTDNLLEEIHRFI